MPDPNPTRQEVFDAIAEAIFTDRQNCGDNTVPAREVGAWTYIVQSALRMSTDETKLLLISWLSQGLDDPDIERDDSA